MAKKKGMVSGELDPNILSLVKVLSSFKGITTVGSCGGHQAPDSCQKPSGEWIVSFKLASNDDGWRALEFLAWLVNNDSRRGGLKVDLIPFAAPPYLNTPGECLVFQLSGWGGEDPEEFAKMLSESKRQFYIPPRASRTVGR